MKKDLEDFYDNFDKKMNMIKRNLKKQYPKEDRQPIIFNFDEVPFWFWKKP